MDTHFTKTAEDFAQAASEYIDLKIDDLKLRTAKGLSITLNRILLAILFLSLISIILMASAFGFVLLLGDVIGSYVAGAFIVAGVFLLLTAVLFFLRNKLFQNGFVRMFIRLFFEDNNGGRI